MTFVPNPNLEEWIREHHEIRNKLITSKTDKSLSSKERAALRQRMDRLTDKIMSEKGMRRANGYLDEDPHI